MDENMKAALVGGPLFKGGHKRLPEAREARGAGEGDAVASVLRRRRRRKARDKEKVFVGETKAGSGERAANRRLLGACLPRRGHDAFRRAGRACVLRCWGSFAFACGALSFFFFPLITFLSLSLSSPSLSILFYLLAFSFPKSLTSPSPFPSPSPPPPPPAFSPSLLLLLSRR